MSLPSTLALTTGNFFSACTAALTKKDMKPSFTPCSFSKRSLYFARISITGAMLTSLKVVRMAAVDCDCTRRSAMRARRRDIGTRCSGRPARMASILTGAGGCASAALGSRGAAADARPAPSTSALVTRPSRPVPAMADVLIPCSSAIFLAAGMTAGCVVTAAAAARAAAGFAAAAGAAGLAIVALPSVSMVAMSSPDTTVLPSPFTILVKTPSTGDGSSSTTLSVSISIRFSSREMA